jgi:pimeloyl-ACP methyl ester carboxylesterase
MVKLELAVHNLGGTAGPLVVIFHANSLCARAYEPLVSKRITSIGGQLISTVLCLCLRGAHSCKPDLPMMWVAMLQAARLVQQGFRCAGIDWPGQGSSPPWPAAVPLSIGGIAEAALDTMAKKGITGV